MESEVQRRGSELLLMRPEKRPEKVIATTNDASFFFSTNEVLRDGVGPEVPVAALARLWRGRHFYVF